MRTYPSVTEVVAAHHAVICLYGGLPGIRDADALESAVGRPRNGYYADLAEEAAALLESLLVNHPFADGNKRAAFAACDVFLRLHGQKIHGDPARLYRLVMDWIVATPANRFALISEDLRGVIQTLP